MEIVQWDWQTKNNTLEKLKLLIVRRETIIQSIAGFEKRKRVKHEEIIDLKGQFVTDRDFVLIRKV